MNPRDDVTCSVRDTNYVDEGKEEEEGPRLNGPVTDPLTYTMYMDDARRRIKYVLDTSYRVCSRCHRASAWCFAGRIFVMHATKFEQLIGVV